MIREDFACAVFEEGFNKRNGECPVLKCALDFKLGDVIRGNCIHEIARHFALIGLAESGSKCVAVKGTRERREWS